MKRISKILAIVLVGVLAFTLTGCKKKADYKDYIGYQFSGKGPWGNELAVTIRTLEDDKLTWTYTDVFGEGEEAITVYSELSSTFKDESCEFMISGSTDKEGVTSSYNGTLTLKDGKVVIKYTDGALTTKSKEGDSSAYQVGALEDADKTVTLTKVVDNS